MYCVCEGGYFISYGVDHSFWLTPADSNVAMSLSIATDALMIGHASSAPVPSPNLISKLSIGRALMASSMVLCPRSAD